MSALVEKIVMVNMGDHMLLQMPQPGPCGGCESCASFFINRSGRVFCVHCDARQVRDEETNAKVTLEMMFSGPVRVQCICPVSRDPSDLFKCTCEASYPENQS